MDLIHWREGYENEVPSMNEQHKTLIELINKAYELIRHHREGEHEVVGIFFAMVEYARRHLVEEEALMERYKYPEVEEHKVAHNDFLRQLDDFQMQLEEYTPAVLTEIYAFLRHWVMDHILQMDKRYGAYLKERMEGDPALTPASLS